MEVGGLVRDPAQESGERWKIADRVERSGTRQRGVVGGGMDRAVTDRMERYGIGAAFATRHDMMPFGAFPQRTVAQRASHWCGAAMPGQRLGRREPGFPPDPSDHQRAVGRDRMNAAQPSITTATPDASGHCGSAVTTKIT